MRLRNDNEHRVYATVNGERRPVGAGEYFDGSDADAKRQGITKVTETEGAAQAAGEITSSEADRAQGVADLSALARVASTAPGRDLIDEDGHRVHGSGIARNPNEPSAPSPVSSPAHDPAVTGQVPPPGFRDSSAPAIASDVIDTLDAARDAAFAGGDVADPQDRGEAPHGTDASNVNSDGKEPVEREDEAPEAFEGATKADLQKAAAANGVEYGKRDTNDALKAKLAAAGVTSVDKG